MPTSKIYLPDVNVWLALASRRHVHAEICSDWLNTIESGTVVFCRITQMGLLRLLTTPAVMHGDVLSSRDAWRVYETIAGDDRIAFASEPLMLETEWRKMTLHDQPAPKIWTDAYLTAFAQAGGMRMVTLDRAMASMGIGTLLLQ